MGRRQDFGSKPKVRGKGDIVFCIDATASMTPCIDGVKNHVRDFIANLKSDGQTTLDWRAKAVGYRDCDGDLEPFVGMENEWVSDLSGIESQLEMITADGGGDAPESLLDALYLVSTKTAWDPGRHRMVIVFTDAPAKPELSSSTLEAGADLSVNTILDAALTEHIKLFYFGPECEHLKPLESDLPKSVFQYVDSTGLESVDFESILSQLGKTVSMAASVGVVAGVSTSA